MRRSAFFLLSPSLFRFWVLCALISAGVLSPPTLRALDYYWDPNTVTDGAQPGSGTWKVGDPNWFISPATQNQVWADGNAAFFAGGVDGAYTVDLAGPITATSLNFLNSGYTLRAASIPSLLTVTAATNAFVVSSGKTAVIGKGLTVRSNLASGIAQFRGGGTLQIAGEVQILSSSAGVNFDIAGGTTVEVLAGGRLASANSIVIGPQTGTGSAGTLIVSGGTVTTAGNNRNFLLGNVSNTTATVTMTAGSISVQSNALTGLRLGFDATTTATFNLDGGILTTPNVFGATGAASTFNFNGGILRTNLANGSFMQGIQNANVKAGGAIIDSNGLVITIGQSLKHDVGTVGQDGGLTKVGNGTLNLTGANTYNGATTAQRGVLNLNFAGSGATDSNIISSSSPLVGKGGTLTATGADAEVNSQTFAGTNFTTGQTTVSAVSGTGGTMNVNLGNVSRSIGSAAQFAPPASGAISAGGLTNTNGIIGAWAMVGSDWATVSGGNIVAYAGYLDYISGTNNLQTMPGYTPTANLRVTAATAGNVVLMDNTRPMITNVNSIMVTDPTARSISLGNAGTGNLLRLGTNGGISMANGAGAVSVTQGTITVGHAPNTGGELVLNNNSAIGGNIMTVNSVIDNNGTGVVTLTKTGTGAVIIGGNNTYTGGTYVAAGRLTVSNNANALGTGTVTVADSGQLTLQGVTVKNNIVLDGRGPGTGGDSGTLRVENQAVVLGNVTLLSDSMINSGGGHGTIRGVISGSFGITGGGSSGTVILGGNNTYTGTTTTGAGNLVVGEGGTSGTFGTGNIVLANGHVFINRSDTYTISQTITSVSTTATGGFNQYGPGTTVLTAANNFNGAVSVARGTLKLDFSAVGAPIVSILNNNALSLRGGTLLMTGGTNAPNLQSFASVRVFQGSSNVSAVSGTGGSMNVTLNGITRDVGGTVNFNLPTSGGMTTTTANASIAGGSQTILGGYATVGNNTWAVSGTGATPGAITGLAAYNSGFAGGAGTDIDVAAGASAGSGAVNSLRFNAAGGSAVDATGGLTVATGGILVTSNVGANATSISGGTLTSGNATDLIVHQHNTAADFTIGSNITGAIGLTKTGAGVLVLTGTNTYTGSTYVTGGTLSISAIENLGDTVGNHTLVLDGGTLRVTSSTVLTTNHSVTLGATAVNTTHSAITSGTIDVASGVVFEIAGTTASTSTRGGLIKEGAGVLVLTGAANHGGGTVINAGILRLGAANRLLDSTSAGGVHIASGAAFELNGFAETINSLTGTGTVRNGHASTSATLQVGVQGTTSNSNGNIDMTFDGLIENGAGGTLAISKAGLGTLTLTNVNSSFTGGLSITNGTVESASIANSGTNSALGSGGNITLGGSTTVGTFRYTGATATTDRFSTVTNHSFIDVVNAGTTLTITSAFSGNLTTASLTKRGAGTLELGGTLQNTNLILIVDEGKVLLSKTPGGSIVSVFGLYVRSGAEVRITNTSGNQIAGTATEDASAGAKGIPQLDGTLDMNGASEVITNFNGDTTGKLTNGAVGTTSTLSFGLTDTTVIGEFAGLIENGLGTMAITKHGTSTEILSGNNTYTGTTNVTGGVLQLGKGGTTGNAGNGTAITISTGATVRTNRSDLIELGQLISGAGSLDVANTSTGITSLTRAAGNTYTGGTTVNSGILLANNTTGSATGTGKVDVLSGATLGGTGAVSASAGTQSITINGGATLMVGSTHGVSTINGGAAADLGLQTGASGVITLAGTVTVDLFGNTNNGSGTNPSSDNDVLRLTSANSVVIDGTLSVFDATGASLTWGLGSTWLLFDWTNVSAALHNSGTFDDFVLPTLNSGLAWDTSKIYTDGTIFITTAIVPEPGRALLLMMGGVTLLMRRRRSRM